MITSITVVDQLENVGAYTSLASGLDGRQHLTYLDVTNHDQKSEVDGALSDVGWHTSLTAVGGSVRIS